MGESHFISIEFEDIKNIVARSGNNDVEIKQGLPENGIIFRTSQNSFVLKCPESVSIFWQP